MCVRPVTKLNRGCITPTSFAEALRDGYPEVVEASIARGLNHNHQDPHGRTPLFNAIRYNQEEVVQVLIPGSNVDLPNHEGETPLIEASKFKGGLGSSPKASSIIVQALIDAGADLNKQDRNGNTALMVASSHAFQKLIDAGADLMLKNNRGETALDMALNHNIKQALALFARQYNGQTLILRK